MAVYDLSSTYDDPSTGFITESRKTLAACMARIEHALGQLTDEDLWWRPHESMNAAGNILLHLCGNVGQWILSGVGGAPMTRNRPAEFSQREPIARDVLMSRLRDTVAKADALFAAQSAASLIEKRHIQGYDTTVIAAIYHVVSHFEGHAQELIYIARIRRGDDYRFMWTPKTPEQKSAQ